MIEYLKKPAKYWFELAPTDYVAETLTDDRRLAATLLSTYLPQKCSAALEWAQITVEPPSHPIDPKTSENRALLFSVPGIDVDETVWLNVVVARNTERLKFTALDVLSNGVCQMTKLYEKRRLCADREVCWPVPILFFFDAKPLEHEPKMSDFLYNPFSNGKDDDSGVLEVNYLTFDLATLDLNGIDPALRLFFDVLLRGENQTLVADFLENKLLWESTEFDWNVYSNERFLPLIHKTLRYVSYLARVNGKPLQERQFRQVAEATRNERVKKEIEYFVDEVFD